MKGKSKKRSRQRWWQKARNIRRAAIGALVAFLVVLPVAYVLLLEKNEREYNVRFASQFTLPTTTGQEVTLNQHLGQHNVLLYFNEGMG